MTEFALTVESVSKRFRKGELHDTLRDMVPALARRLFGRSRATIEDDRVFWALRDVSFDVMRGEAFGIIGHNGAGKSTMLKILSRIMKPTAGKMTVRGRLSALIEVSAGFHPDLTGRENIYLNGVVLGMSRREIDSKFDLIVDFSGLEDFIDTPVKRYSSGMYARLGFSIAAHVDPEVLVVDEVLSVGDFAFQKKCLARMRQVLQGGTTVLFVSHNLRAVADLCTRSLLLDHGKVLSIGPTAGVIRSYMDLLRGNRVLDDLRVAIRDVRLGGNESETIRFQTHDVARVFVEVVARELVKRVSVGVYIVDDEDRMMFTTSTQKMGYPPYDFDGGSVLSCEMELNFAMAPGTYHLCVVLHRYDIGETYDEWQRAVTFYVGSPENDWSGLIPCKATLLRAEMRDDVEHSAKMVARASVATSAGG